MAGRKRSDIKKIAVTTLHEKHPELTMEEIGSILGLTRQRVWQILKNKPIPDATLIIMEEAGVSYKQARLVLRKLCDSGTVTMAQPELDLEPAEASKPER